MTNRITTALAVLLIFLSLAVLVSGCVFAERKPGEDGVFGTPDDEAAPIEDAADWLAPLLSLLGFGAVGAGIAAAAEGTATVATEVRRRRETA